MSTIFALPVARHGIQAQLIEESSLHFREACIIGEQLPRILLTRNLTGTTMAVSPGIAEAITIDDL